MWGKLIEFVDSHERFLVTSHIHWSHDVETLEYLGKATVLLEYLKRDIRSASSEVDSIRTGAGRVAVERTDDQGRTTLVSYEYKGDERCVVRQEQGFLGLAVTGRRYDIGLPDSYLETLRDFRRDG